MIKFLLAFGFFVILLFPLLLALGAALIYGVFRFFKHETRFRRYFAKYKNDEIARMVTAGKIWTGQTIEQLRDAKGEPLQIMSENSDQIWVYPPNPLTRQPVRVTFKEGRVADWS